MPLNALAAKASRSLLRSAPVGANQMSTGHLAPASRYSGITTKTAGATPEVFNMFLGGLEPPLLASEASALSN